MACISSRAETELFRCAGAELSLVVAGEESVMMQGGDFVLLLVKHASSPLAAVVATVGDMQWPVGKDSLVLKHKDYRYSFSLPAALTFAVTFSSPDTAHLQQLDSLLRQYSTFAPRPPPQAGTAEVAHSASEFWTAFAAGKQSSTSSVRDLSRKRDPGSMSPKLAAKMQQARRMSAVQKLFTRSVERGAINASTHVTVAEAADTSSAEVPKLAVATVDAVAKVVEAVETAGRTLQDNRDYDKDYSKRTGEGIDAAGNLKTSAWTLNKVGLRMLFRTIASIQTRKNASHGDSAASSSQDASPDLQQPSSLSSGTSSPLSSKMPMGSPPSAAETIGFPWQVHEPLQKLSCSPPCQAVDDTPAVFARANSPYVVISPRGQAVSQGAIRPFPLPPRFCGAAMPPPRLVGVTPTGAIAPVAPPGYHTARVGLPEQTVMFHPPPPPPPPPRHPPRPPHDWPI